MVDDSAGDIDARSQPAQSRRAFLGSLGTAVAATVGVPSSVEAQNEPTIAMDTDHFDPVGLHVEPGTTVRFEIVAGSHSATAYEDRIPADATAFDSGTFSDGGFGYTFETPGTYDYYCSPHRSLGMVGRIVVGEPGGPAEATPIPEGEVPASDAIREQGPIGSDAFGGQSGSDRSMMESGVGMMGDKSPGWKLLVPIGFLTTVLGSVGGVAYWASRRGTADRTEERSALSSLEHQYARGEIDEEEFQRRCDQLQQNE